MGTNLSDKALVTPTLSDYFSGVDKSNTTKDPDGAIANFLGSDVLSLFDGSTGTLENKTIAAGDNTITDLADANVASDAAIGLSKLAALTGSRALVSTSGGVVSASAVTATELGYLDGVTSAIQTQLDALSGGISNIVEDTTPQLGGNLDMNGSTIAGATETELGYSQGVTSAIQTQIDGKQAQGDVLDDLNSLGASTADGEFLVATGAGALAWEGGATARTSLGVAIGSDVQAFGAVLDDLNTLGAVGADGEFLVGTAAGALAWESGATARASLGLVIGTDVGAAVFADRTTAAAATIPTAVLRIQVATPQGRTISYVRDASGTALTTNGATVNWSPDGVAAPDHWAENTTPGTTLMTTAVQAAIDFVYAGGGGTVDVLDKYLVDAEIDWPDLIEFRGHGWRLDGDDFNTPYGSGFYLKSSSGVASGDGVIRALAAHGEAFAYHRGVMHDMFIHGNGANNAGVHGVVFDCVKKIDLIQVGILRCADDAFATVTDAGLGTNNNIALTRCHIFQNLGKGGEIYGGEHTFVGNFFSANGGIGLHIGAGSSRLAANHFCDNASGIYIGDCQALTITGNLIQDNEGNGITIGTGATYHDFMTITGNTIVDNGQDTGLADTARCGISIESATVLRCTITGNSIGNRRKAGDTSYPNSPAQQYGVRITEAAARVQYWGNDVGLNVTADLSLAATANIDYTHSGNLTIDGGGLLHVDFDGGTLPTIDAETVAVFSNCDTTTDDCLVSIISGATGVAHLNFGDTADENRASFRYQNQYDAMDLWIAATKEWTWYNGAAYPEADGARDLGTTSKRFRDYIFSGALKPTPGSDTDQNIITVGVTGSPTISWDESGDVFSSTHGFEITAGAFTISTTNGADINPGSDTSADLITVGVTGAPTLSWDEGNDIFTLTHGLDLAAGDLTTTGEVTANNYLGTDDAGSTYFAGGANKASGAAILLQGGTAGKDIRYLVDNLAVYLWDQSLGKHNFQTYQIETTGNISGGIVFPSSTAAEIADVADAINTTNKVAGKGVLDTTNNRLMIASGSAAADPWYVADASASVTPA